MGGCGGVLADGSGSVIKAGGILLVTVLAPRSIWPFCALGSGVAALGGMLPSSAGMPVINGHFTLSGG